MGFHQAQALSREPEGQRANQQAYDVQSPFELGFGGVGAAMGQRYRTRGIKPAEPRHLGKNRPSASNDGIASKLMDSCSASSLDERR